MFDIIIFAVISIFLLWKLKDILGKEDGDIQERAKNKSYNPIIKDITDSSIQNQTSLPKQIEKLNEEQLEANLKENLALLSNISEEDYRAISKLLPEKVFNVKQFHNMIEFSIAELLNAFSTKDAKSISNFCSKDLLKNIEQLIKNQIDNSDKNISSHVHLVKINKIEIKTATIQNNKITIITNINTDQIRYTYNTETQEIISGSKSKSSSFCDSLTFERDTKNQDYGWVLTKID